MFETIKVTIINTFNFSNYKGRNLCVCLSVFQITQKIVYLIYVTLDRRIVVDQRMYRYIYIYIYIYRKIRCNLNMQQVH